MKIIPNFLPPRASKSLQVWDPSGNQRFNSVQPLLPNMKVYPLDNSKEEEKSTFIRDSPQKKSFNIALCNFQAYIFNSVIFPRKWRLSKWLLLSTTFGNRKTTGPCPMLVPTAIQNQPSNNFYHFFNSPRRRLLTTAVLHKMEILNLQILGQRNKLQKTLKRKLTI